MDLHVDAETFANFGRRETFSLAEWENIVKALHEEYLRTVKYRGDKLFVAERFCVHAGGLLLHPACRAGEDDFGPSFAFPATFRHVYECGDFFLFAQVGDFILPGTAIALLILAPVFRIPAFDPGAQGRISGGPRAEGGSCPERGRRAGKNGGKTARMGAGSRETERTPIPKVTGEIHESPCRQDRNFLKKRRGKISSCPD
ncbi:hypothetical protein RJ40_00730 [Methanofollis aquaemaris]|uniref:Uncharacterized protein n=1 Tax=Methanofollis aquaemaris TaxID=126734 RepID=A0A8A3S143_9EURY|nr:hypothetical protein RJ40_00730 [Methanofollis aquaemaris]